MTNFELKTLAEIIATSGINTETANTLLKKLKKSEQKLLVQKLKIAIQKNKLVVTSAISLDTKSKNALKGIFNKDNVETVENSDLGAGMIIQDNDTIYDMSFKGRLKNTLSQVTDAL